MPDHDQSRWAVEEEEKDSQLRWTNYEDRYQWVTHLNVKITQMYGKSWNEKEDCQQ